MTGVWDGIVVLDLSWGIAGPMATMLMADNGADVVKIEPPGGDPFRTLSGARIWHRGKRILVEIRHLDHLIHAVFDQRPGFFSIGQRQRESLLSLVAHDAER